MSDEIRRPKLDEAELGAGSHPCRGAALQDRVPQLSLLRGGRARGLRRAVRCARPRADGHRTPTSRAPDARLTHAAGGGSAVATALRSRPPLEPPALARQCIRRSRARRVARPRGQGARARADASSASRRSTACPSRSPTRTGDTCAERHEATARSARTSPRTCERSEPFPRACAPPSPPAWLEVRGEVFLRVEDFERVNAELGEAARRCSPIRATRPPGRSARRTRRSRRRGRSASTSTDSFEIEGKELALVLGDAAYLQEIGLRVHPEAKAYRRRRR